MSTEWRLLDDGIHEARHHFALEEALARLVDEGQSPPTLRLRRVHPAVFVGINQDTWSEVDVAYCQAHGIQIVRRMSGGGAVYHETGSFCYSAFFPRDLLPQNEQECYRLFAEPAIRTCADYGVTAAFQGRNDLLVGNRKIYGSAQFTWYRAFVQSGTFLVNMDFEVMARALTPPALKFDGKTSRSIQERVTSLSRQVGRDVDTQEAMARFASHTADVLGIQLAPGGLLPAEERLAAELLAVKYGTEAWNLGSPLEFQAMVADRTDEGVISLSADVVGKTIQRARISGDILLSRRQDLDALERALTGCTLAEAQHAVQAAALSKGMRASLLRLVEKLGEQIIETASARLKENVT